MVIWPEFRMWQFWANDYWEDPLYITTNIYFLYTDDMYFINKGTFDDTEYWKTELSIYYSSLSQSDDPFFI